MFAVLAFARSDYSRQVEAYLDRLDERDRKRVAALLKRSAEYGPPRNQEKCRKIGGFWEFKAGQERIFWCYDPGQRKRIILLHGFTKKTEQTPRHELQAGQQAYRAVQQELGR